MSEYQDYTVTLPFSVPSGDASGVMTEALFGAALALAPSEAVGFAARGDSEQGKVWIVFTLPNSSREFVDDVSKQMQQRVRDAVFSGDDACVTVD